MTAVSQSWPYSSTASALVVLARTGVCPPDGILALEAGTFMRAGKITDVGRKTAVRILAARDNARKQAIYAAGRQAQYPLTVRDKYGFRECDGSRPATG